MHRTSRRAARASASSYEASRARPRRPGAGAFAGRVLAAALVAGAALAGAAAAIGQGRVMGTVVDGAGAPLAGVKVVILSPEMPTFHVEKTTDGHGQFNAILLDATREYRVRFEKAGYETLEQPLRPKVEDTLKQTFTLQSAAAPAAGETAPPATAPGQAPDAGPQSPAAPPASGAGSTAPPGASAPQPAPPGAGSPSSPPPNPEAVKAYNDGVAALRAKDTAGAIAKMEQAQKLDPKLAAAPAVLADLYLDQKRPADAVAAADRALALEPGRPRLMLVRYQALRALGDRARAAQALDELLAHPSPEVARDLAVFLYNDAADASRAKDLDAAVADLKRALTVDPSLEPAYGALANIYMAKQDYRAALELADRWVATAPQSPQALQVRYEALTRLNDPRAKEARAAMEQAHGGAAALSPLNHGIELYNTNHIPDAIKVFEGIVAADPRAAKAQYMLGLCYTNTGDLVRARASLEAFLKLAPDDPEAPTARQMLKDLH